MKIKFCGNCNPRVDPKRVKMKIGEMCGRQVDPPDLLVNGCERMCLTRKPREDHGRPATVLNGWELYSRDN